MPDTVHNAGPDCCRVMTTGACSSTFDGAEFEAIHTARDVARAHALLAQDPNGFDLRRGF